MEPEKSPPPSPKPYSEALAERMKNDTCFKCQNLGHWAPYCPYGSPSKAKPSASASRDEPLMQCTCGASCKVFTSGTQKNPNRKFYSCPGNSPGEKGCGFIAWCDFFTARRCACNLGMCRIYAEKKDNGDRCFKLGCLFKKGHGSCGFSLPIDVKKPVTEPPQIGRMEIEPLAMDSPDNSYVVAEMNQDHEIEELLQHGDKKLKEMMLGLSGPEHMNCGDMQEIEMETGSGTTSPDSDVEDPILEEEIALLDQISQIETVAPIVTSHKFGIHRYQEDFMKQIFAVGDGLPQDAFNILLGLQVIGWYGRIDIPPSPPTKAFFHRIFPSLGETMQTNNGEVIDNRVSNVFPRLSSEPGLNAVSEPSSPRSKTNDEQIMHLLGWLADMLSGGNTNHPSNSRTEGNYSEILQRTVLKVQNEFITQLDRIEPLDLDLLKNEALVCFATLGLLRTTNCGEFIRRVMHYLECASSLGKAESCHEPNVEFNCKELKDRYSIEQKHYEEISQIYNDKLAAYSASLGELQKLSQKADRLREELTRIEIEMAERESESLELEKCLVKVNQEVKRSKRSFEEVAREVNEAEGKEVKRAAAMSELEKAKFLLREMVQVSLL